MYATLSTPDGLTFAIYGPVVCQRHDVTVFRNSGWEEILQ